MSTTIWKHTQMYYYYVRGAPHRDPRRRIDVTGTQFFLLWLGGSPHLSCKRDQDKIRDYMNRRVTSPTWGPHLHVNRSSDIRLIFWENFRFVSLLTFRVNQLLNIAVQVFFSSRKVEVVKLHLHAIIESKDSFKEALAAFRTFSSKRKNPRCTPRDYSLFIIWFIQQITKNSMDQ